MRIPSNEKLSDCGIGDTSGSLGIEQLIIKKVETDELGEDTICKRFTGRKRIGGHVRFVSRRIDQFKRSNPRGCIGNESKIRKHSQPLLPPFLKGMVGKSTQKPVQNQSAQNAPKFQKDNVIQNVIEWPDEKSVDEALNRDDLEEEKRLAFAFARREEPASPDSKTKTKPAAISIPHRRSRAKVYMAMKDWEAALADIQETYLQVNSKAGWLRMCTAELVKTENLKTKILTAMEQEKSEK